MRTLGVLNHTKKDKSMTSIRNLNILVVLLLITGCGTVTDSASPSIGNTDASFTATYVVKPGEVFQDYELTDAVLNNIKDVNDKMEDLVSHYKEGEISAEELNVEANEIISKYLEDPFLRIVIPQVVSFPTLITLLESQDINGLEPYIAHHTQLLVDNDSPHAERISQSLEMLDNYWDDEKIQTVAKRAIENAEYYLGKSSAHVASKAAGDQLYTDVPIEELQGSRAKVYAEMNSGIKNLEHLLDQ